MNFHQLLNKVKGRIAYEKNKAFRLKVPHKIVVIESDDWGLERAVSPEGWEKLLKKYPEEKRTRWFYDSIESKEDMDKLFHIFHSYANKFDKKPIITGNFITHNIDYSSPNELKLKGMTANSSLPKNIYMQAISEHILEAQLHGYTHYNVDKLKKHFADKEGKEDFEFGFFVAQTTIKGKIAGLHGEYSTENTLFKSDFKIAQQEFKNYFGFDSKSVIPCTYILDQKIEDEIIHAGISLIQAADRMTDHQKNKRHLPSFRFKNNIFYGTRNARLDIHPDYNHLGNLSILIKDMEAAFNRQMPCVIDFHRVNFAALYNPKWADECLKELNSFFDYCHKKHPSILFLSTTELVDYIKNGNKID